MDYNKEFHFDFANYLEFHVWKDTIYFAQGKGSGIGKGGPLFAIDFASKTCRTLPFKLPNDDYLRVHLSGNDRYLMIHIYFLESRYDRFRASKTYVMDLAQDNRTFVLESCLGRIYDALIWDQKIILLGSKEELGTSSLYEYDIKNHHITELICQMEDNHSFYYSLGSMFTGNFGTSALWSQQFISIKKMQYINGIYYFLIHEKDGHSNETRYRYCEFDPSDPSHENLNGKLIDYDRIFCGQGDGLNGSTEIIPSNEGVFCLGNDNWLSSNSSNGVRRFNFQTRDVEYIVWKKGATYFLIGDYLYVQMYSGEWQKTNISNGWDNLQWEIMSFDD